MNNFFHKFTYSYYSIFCNFTNRRFSSCPFVLGCNASMCYHHWLVCSYLYNHKDTENIKWAVAGRDEAKLSAIADQYSIDYIVADSFDLSSLKKMCESTKLVLTTVGPYMLYGENLVYSCISAGTHYLDLRGEPGFVLSMYKKYRAKAFFRKFI